MTIMQELAQAAYEAWAENKNVASWEDLPDSRRWQWRNVARAVLAKDDEINNRKSDHQQSA